MKVGTGRVRGDEGLSAAVTAGGVTSRTVGETVRPARVGVARGGIADTVGVDLGVEVKDSLGVALGKSNGAKVAGAVAEGEGSAVDARTRGWEGCPHADVNTQTIKRASTGRMSIRLSPREGSQIGRCFHRSPSADDGLNDTILEAH